MQYPSINPTYEGGNRSNQHQAKYQIRQKQNEESETTKMVALTSRSCVNAHRAAHGVKRITAIRYSEMQNPNMPSVHVQNDDEKVMKDKGHTEADEHCNNQPWGLRLGGSVGVKDSGLQEYLVN
jgi:hypothetical protein